MAAATTDRARAARSRQRGPDRISVALFSLAAFLVLVALLGTQLTGGSRGSRTVPVLLRKVYRTTVIERVLPAGSGGRGGVSVTQSQSGSASGGLAEGGVATRAS